MSSGSSNSPNEILLGGLSLRHVEQIVRKAEKYKYYPHASLKDFRFRRDNDYEGSPEQYLRLEKEGRETWNVSLTYRTTIRDNYDFIAVVRKDNSTAYKMKLPGPPREMKFILSAGSWGSLDGVKPDQIYAELSKMNEFISSLDETTTTIDTWVKSGLDMEVLCAVDHCLHSGHVGCARRSLISNEALSDYERRGLSLADLQQRLICSQCGKRYPRLRPMPRPIGCAEAIT